MATNTISWICQRCNLHITTPFCPMCGAAQLQQVEIPAEKTPRRAKHKRSNGMGTAIKRGRTWTARVIVGWKAVDGKRRAVYRTKGGFSTKRDALLYCAELKKNTKRGKAPNLIKYWEDYEAVKLPTLSESKQQAYRIAWAKLSDLHYLPVDNISAGTVMQKVAAVAPTFYTARDCKTVLTKLFELAAADGWCSKEIPSFIELPKQQEKERQVFTAEEQSALWKLYDSGDLRAAIPLMMICTGMMPGEAMQLKTEHINLEEKKIVGVGMKTKVRKASPIYIPEDIIPMVQDLIDHAQPTGYIWPHTEDRWRATYYEALDAAGCRRLEPYCCRHSTATRLAITEGIAPQTIQRIMRWSTSRMLDRYAHPSETDILEALNTSRRGVE